MLAVIAAMPAMADEATYPSNEDLRHMLIGFDARQRVLKFINASLDEQDQDLCSRTKK